MLCDMELCGKGTGSSKDQRIYLSGTGDYRSNLIFDIKRKNHAAVGLRCCIDGGRTDYIRNRIWKKFGRKEKIK